jgi:uncharacterized protein
MTRRADMHFGVPANGRLPTPLRWARMNAGTLAQHEALAAVLLPRALEASDGSHDVAHLRRVWKYAATLQAAEGGKARILAAAVLLHDCVAVEKDSSRRKEASRLAATKASEMLRDLRWHVAEIAAVAHAIEAHSFSAGIRAETLEAKILQDADRLDALGMVGVARCFYVGGRLGHALYDPVDPQAKSRAHNDQRYALDHFYTKLLTLASGFQTKTGTELAREKERRLRRFLDEFLDEI